MTLSKKQLSIMVFFIPLVFKMAMLPSLFYQVSNTDSYIGIGVMTALEFLQLWLILFLVSKGGIRGIKEIYGINVARAVALPLLFVMGVKSIIFLTEIYTYICDFLFYNISSTPVILALLIVIFYLAFKGIKAIGHVFELSIWIIPLIAIFGVVFGKFYLNSDYLEPLFVDGAGAMFKGIDTYIIYAFDFSPLLLFQIEKKKNLAVVITSISCILVTTALYVVLIANYGRATFLVNGAFARLASFNTVVSEIGSLDWPSALLWITTATGSLALKFAAMGEILKLFKVKKQYGIGATCIVIGILTMFVFPGLKEVLKLATGPVRYVTIALEIAVPIVVLALYAADKYRTDNSKNTEGKIETQN